MPRVAAPRRGPRASPAWPVRASCSPPTSAGSASMKTSQTQLNHHLLLTDLIWVKAGGGAFAEAAPDTNKQREAAAFPAGKASSKEAVRVKPRRPSQQPCPNSRNRSNSVLGKQMLSSTVSLVG